MFPSVILLLAAFATADTARVMDSTLVIEPVGVSVRIPPVWLGSAPVRPYQTCGSRALGTVADRIHVDPTTFASLEHATGEWDSEYSAVADSILPFRDLAAQLGSRGFGHGGCFAALLMRVYVTSLTARDIDDRARGIGVATATSFFPSAKAFVTDSAGWHIARVRWDARYSDYGSDANVELYVQEIGPRRVVLVFMHSTWPEGGQLIDRDQILASFRSR